MGCENEHDDVFDSANDNSRLARLLPGISGIGRDLDLTYDSTLSSNENEINLIIAELYDQDGNRHPEFEDTFTQESHEPEAENTHVQIPTDSNVVTTSEGEGEGAIYNPVEESTKETEVVENLDQPVVLTSTESQGKQNLVTY